MSIVRSKEAGDAAKTNYFFWGTSNINIDISLKRQISETFSPETLV